MISSKKYLQGLFVICFFLLSASCQTPLSPEYEGFDDLRIGKLDMQESLISTSLKFYNPNSFGLQLKKAEMDIFVNEKLVDHYLLDSTINIPKKDTFFIPVSIKINFSNMLSNALQSILKNEIKIRLDGKAKLKKGAVGFTMPLHYEDTQKLDALMNQ
ncbi:MAG TPA: LEA type 2 family protein [Puia sp.]|nr:LEA type 2 family protein [Puia sp.]